MIRLTIPYAALLIVSLTSSLLAEEGRPSHFIVSSEVLTEPDAAVAPGIRTTPRAVAVDDGYCVAWRDTRQGGSIMAARVGADGTVLDPLGIPIQADWHGPRAVLRTWEGCSIVTNGLVMLEHDGTVRSLMEGPFDGRFITSDGTRALFIRWEGSGPSVTSLAMIDGYGTALATGAIEGTPTYEPLLWADIRDERLFIARSSRDSNSGLIEIWNGDVDLQLDEIGSFELNPSHDVRIATDGQFALVVTAELSVSGDPWTGWGNMRARLMSSSGEVVSEVVLDDPIGSDGRPGDVWYANGAYRIIRHSDSGTHLITTDGYDITGLRSVPPWFEQEVVSGDDGKTLTVTKTNTQDLVYTVEGVPTEPRRLTSAPPHEVLVDTALTEDKLALLWYETETNQGGAADLFVAVGSRDEVDVSTAIPVAAMSRYAGRGAAITLGGNEVIVVWPADASLEYRRMGLDGTWRDPEPVEMRGLNGVYEFDRHGLSYGPDGFVVTWLDWHGRPMVGLISPDGHSIQAVEVDKIQSLIESTTLIDLGDHYLLGWTEKTGLCEFTCPVEPNPVGLTILDRSFERVEQISAETEGEVLMARGDGMALVLLGHKGILIETSLTGFGDRVELELAPLNRFTPTSVMWTGSEFLIAGYYFDQAQHGSSVIRLSPDGSSELVGSNPVMVPDHGGVDRYAPFAFPRNHDLILLGSEVSLRPDEGFVRRLRETVARPATHRVRAVRRPR